MEPKTPIKAQPYGTQDDQFTFFNGAAGGTNANSGMLTVAAGVKSGSIMISTNSAYDGTTGTVVLQGSNDGGTTWAGVLQDDNATAMSFTLAAGANTDTFQLKRVLFKFYRLVYTAGNATLGTVTANYVGKI